MDTLMKALFIVYFASVACLFAAGIGFMTLGYAKALLSIGDPIGFVVMLFGLVVVVHLFVECARSIREQIAQ